MNDMKIILLGAPGAGKGTYASHISPLLNIPHISTGDLVRAEIKAGSDLGEKVKEYSSKGLLVPDEVITAMLKKRLAEKDAEKGCILDGFPRTIPQADMLGTIAAVDLVINIELDEDIIVQKIAGRRVCRQCGDIYNVADINKGDLRMPPLLPHVDGVCDKCGGELYQRNDDKESVVVDRLKIYHEQTAPLIEYYRKKGLLKDFQVSGPPEKMVPELLNIISDKK